MDVYNGLCSLIVKTWKQYSDQETKQYIRDNSICSEDFKHACSSSKSAISCPLAVASLLGRKSIVRTLIEAGFEPGVVCNISGLYIFYERLYMSSIRPKEKSKYSKTKLKSTDRWFKCRPLHLACQGRHWEVVKMLIEDYHVDVNAEDDAEFAAIHYAVMSSRSSTVPRLKIVKYLVEAGADFLKEARGAEPIHYAASKGCRDICEYLLSKGARMLSPKGFNKTRLNFISQHEFAIGLMLSEAELLETDVKLDTGEPLPHLCAQRGLANELRLFCSVGLNPDLPDDQGKTPLRYAVDKFVEGPFCESTLALIRFLIIDKNVSLFPGRKVSLWPIYKALLEPSIIIIELVLAAGHHAYIQKVSQLKKYSELKKKLKTAGGFIHHSLSNPGKLEDLCCFRVRRTLGSRMPSIANSLPLPSSVRDVIKLTYVSSMLNEYSSFRHQYRWDT